MASRSFARPLTQDDHDLLMAIDQTYATRLGLKPIVTPASLNFYTRSGHSFVAVEDGRASGFVLAHAIWNGDKSAVLVSRLAVSDVEDLGSREALLEAVTKSAYDAAVYDIQVQHPQNDTEGLSALRAKSYQAIPFTMFERILGSRGQYGG